MNLSNISKRYMGKPYRLGCTDMSAGCDCFSMIADYLKENGIKLPEKYRGYKVDEYAQLFIKNPGIVDVAVSFIAEHTQEIPEEKAVAGDIVVATLSGLERPLLSFGIDAGNGNMIIVSDQKVGLISKKFYNILKVFRCRKPFR